MSHHYSGPDFGFPHGDARLDLTDLYAFPKPGDASKSILIMNVHPSAGVNPPGPRRTNPSRPRRFMNSGLIPTAITSPISHTECASPPTKTGRRLQRCAALKAQQAAGTGDDGHVIVEGAPVSTGRGGTGDGRRGLPLLRRLAQRSFFLRHAGRAEQPAVHR